MAPHFLSLSFLLLKTLPPPPHPTHQVIARLGSPFHPQASQGTPVRETRFTDMQQIQGQTALQFRRFSYEDQLYFCYLCAGSLGSIHA